MRFSRARHGEDFLTQRRQGRRDRARSYEQPVPILDANPKPWARHDGPAAVRHGCKHVVGICSAGDEQDAGDQRPTLPRDLFFRRACNALLATTPYTAAQHAWFRHTRNEIRFQPTNHERSRGRPRPVLRGLVRLAPPTLRGGVYGYDHVWYVGPSAAPS